MSACPTCSNEIDEDFGLVTCKKCGSQFMVGMDGGPVSVPPVPTSEASPVQDAPVMPNSQPNVLAQELSQILEQEIAVGSQPQELPEVPMTYQQDQFQSGDMPPALDSAPPEFFPEEEPVPMPPATPDMSEIADFGNKDTMATGLGYLRFNVFIMGIDSEDIRSDLKEALSDMKFKWNVDQLFSEMKNGQLKLKEVPAVKVSLVLQRIRSLPVEVRWEQLAIHQ